ncbi:MAG: isocitrate dehydrogenase (NADP(+)) [Candidatus Bathyarchaeia archaeon]
MRRDDFVSSGGGERIRMDGGVLQTPENPVIPVIEGDGTGPDIFRAARPVIDAAVERAYDRSRAIAWLPLLAGEEAMKECGEPLPKDTIETLRNLVVGIKGPLITPVAGGFRSLNVTLRQELDLYACVRPVRWFRGVPAPVRHPERLDVVIFRENTEDVYAGIEWRQGSAEAKKVIAFLAGEMGKKVRDDSGLGVKPISAWATRRIVRAAISYAVKHGRRSVTLVHKGNIMKFTEGAFREWGYAVAGEEFREETVTEEELSRGAESMGRIVVKDRIADSMFQQLLLRPEEYDVLVTPNLNGDYLSDACAAQVGGIGMAPGANINYETGVALFEATHGAAPKYAGKDVVNPSSLILSGSMMLEYMGWREASSLIVKGLERTIRQKTVTYDLARMMRGAREVRCSEFGRAVVKNILSLPRGRRRG